MAQSTTHIEVHHAGRLVENVKWPWKSRVRKHAEAFVSILRQENGREASKVYLKAIELGYGTAHLVEVMTEVTKVIQGGKREHSSNE